MAGAIRRVLVVDDDRDIRALIVLNLELSGYEVVAAEDGHEAAVLAPALQPDAIVLDGMMPGMDGLDLLRRLKADPATAHIPVVMLTARVGDHDVWSGWEAGAHYYITKPFDPDHLVDYLRHLEDPDGCPLPG